eukprot:SAG22_NODE_1241_length_5034_cov_4.301317_2_plen_1433_part_00
MYLAESIANDANEWLLEGYDRSMWHSVGEAHNYAAFLASWRSASIDRSRIADGAVVYCLPCIMWRAIGPFSFYRYPGGPAAAPENFHERDLGRTLLTLDRSHRAFEVVIFDHPRFYNNSAGLSRLRPPDEGGYEWIILPSTDAMSDSHAEAVLKYVRGGGHAILINSGNQSCGMRDEELAWRKHGALAGLQANPGSGRVSIIGDMPEEQMEEQISTAINGSGQIVIVSGAPASTLMNTWRHGVGPMVSVNLVNYDISHNVSQIGVSVGIAELRHPSTPVARLLSLDFVGDVRSLPVTASAGRLHVTIPELQTHTLLVIASSDEEFQCREAAAQTRLWLQRSMLAYRSHALRQASREHKNISSIVLQWAHLANADSLLSILQGDDATLHLDPGWYKNMQAQLQNSTVALQESMSSVQIFASESELRSRTEILEMCKSSLCVAALNFNDAGFDDSPAGFIPVASDQTYNSTRGFGFLNTTGLLAFDTSKPDPLHRGGIFSRRSATLRIDIDLAVPKGASSASSLVLTLISGYHDLGAQSVLDQSLGVNLSSSDCKYKGRPSNTTCIRTRNAIANRLTSAWTGFASTSVAVAVRAAGNISSPLSLCMLGSTGRNPGYFLTRSCRVNISAVAKIGSSRLQMDVVLAPDQGMTGCFGHNCGELAFAWLLNALVVSLPDNSATDFVPARSRASLTAVDAMSATAIRDWMWIGPFDGSDGDGLNTDFGIESDLLQPIGPLPALLNKTYAGKAGHTVSWKRYTAAPEGSAPYLPLSQLLPEREQNTGSVAFAIANIWSEAGGKASLQCGMSGRGRVWLVTTQRNGTRVVEDRMIFGLTADESKAELSLARGWNAFVVKTESIFAADSVTLDGAPARSSGVTEGKIGVQLRENEWSLALAIESSLPPTLNLKTDDLLDLQPQVNYTDFDAPGFGEQFTYEYSIPIGHGYMDPVVVATDNGVFTPLFYPCGGGTPKSQYCIQVLKNGKAYSKVINLACSTLLLSAGETSPASCVHYLSYQVPQLYHYASIIWMVWWIYMPSRATSAVVLASVEERAPGDGVGHFDQERLQKWTRRGMQMMNRGWDMNYLGGCLGPSGKVFVTGWLQNGTHGTLGLLSFDLVNVSTVPARVTPTMVGPLYSTGGAAAGMLSPLYSMCVALSVSGDEDKEQAQEQQQQQLQLHIMTTIDNSRPCAGHVHTAYKEVIYYAGMASRIGGRPMFSPFSVLWRNASADNYSQCLYNNARFGTDLVAVGGDGKIIASYRASQIISSANYTQRWSLVEVAASSSAHRVLCADVSKQFGPLISGAQLRSVTITTMDAPAAGNDRSAAGSSSPLHVVIGSAVAPQNYAVLVMTRDFKSFSAPLKLDAPFGIGDTIHVNQPNKNGGSARGCSLFLWWGGRVAGGPAPPTQNDFLRFRLPMSLCYDESRKALRFTPIITISLCL